MTSPTDKQKLLIVAVLLVIITSLVYRPVLHHDFIDYDDPDYVTHNEVVQRGVTGEGFKWAFTTGHASNWHPVTWLSHMLDAQTFGTKPMGHHGMNLVLHVANSVLLLLLLWQMTGVVMRSALVAALFALHPLHVESVAWVAERKDVLSTFFGILCLMAYVKYARSKAEGRGSKVAYALALLFLALGLMSKPMLVTWPFVMLLLDVWPLQRIPSTLDFRVSTLKPLLLEKLPFFALVVGSCIATFLVQQQGGAVTTMENLPLEDRLGNAIVSYAKYLFMTLWPVNLAIFYPHPDLAYPASTQWPDWSVGVTSLALLAASVLIFKRRNDQPYLFTGWFWYLGTLVPVIGLVQVGTQALADRYTYIPLIGIFMMLAWGGNALFQRLKLPAASFPVMGTALALICAILSGRQVKVWQDDFSLFGHALQVTTGNAPAHSTLGKAWAKKGDFEKALEHLSAAKAAYPHYPNVHYDIGLTLFYLGRYPEAIEEYLAELARKPDHIMARNNLAIAYRSAGKPKEAIEQYQLVLQSNPDYLQSLHGLGSALIDVDQGDEAATYLTKALEIDPDLKAVRVDLARALTAARRFKEAEQTLLVITDIDQPRVRILQANIWMESGRTNDAREVFASLSIRFPNLAEEYLNSGKHRLAAGQLNPALTDLVTAARLSPSMAEAHLYAGLVLAQSGRIESAIHSLETAAALRPDASIFYHLGVAYGMQSRHREAIGWYRKTLELDPDSVGALNNLAWILATHPDPALRDGRSAVELAERACKISDFKQPVFLGTLAATYAETGRFDDAIRTGEQARQSADRAGLSDLAKRNSELVEQYRSGKPYRDASPAP